MPWPARAVLLLSAAIVGASFAALGNTFSAMAEPSRHEALVTAFWMTAGAALAAPMWVPAVLPRALGRIAGWAGAILVVLPLLLFGSILVHGIERWLAGAAPATLGFAMLTTGACAVSLVLLGWQAIGARRRRPRP